MQNVIIIGGGIAGLSAAWEIQQARKNISFTILEASNRWGGKLATRTMTLNHARFIVDGGAESFVTRKPEVWNLAHELGLSEALINPGSETSHMYVLDGGVAKQVPLSPGLFISSDLLSWRGKLRLFAEPFQPARRDSDDESLASFATRRLGAEASEKMIGPILGGIYNTDPHKQSILVSSPIMREMERESGSLMLASLQRMFRPKPRTKDGKRRPSFITFENGVEPLIEALVQKLQGDLRLNARVTAITRDGENDKWHISLADGSMMESDAVIIATLANVAAELLRTSLPEIAERLEGIKHYHIGTISLVYRESDIPAEPVINGLMVPRREQRAIDALTFTSRKMPGRSTPGYALLRVFLGGARPDVVEMDDEAIVTTVRAELKDLIKLDAKPLAYTIFRWLNGFPQAEIGHLERMDQLEAILPPGLVLAGSSYRGIAVPDCIKQARMAVRKII